MANTIQVKRKTTTGAPTIGSLADGEFCLVVPDSLLYQRVDASTLIVVNGGASSLPVEISFALSDETTDLTVGASKITFRMPYAMTLTEVRASVATAPTGSNIIVDINQGGTTIMTTDKLSIDASEKTSTTATTAAGLTTTALTDDAEITVDIDQVGSTIAGAGLKITFIGTRA